MKKIITLPCTLFLSVLLFACGSGSGSDSDGGGANRSAFKSFGSEVFDDPANAPAPEVLLLGGDWSVKETVKSDNCGEDANPPGTSQNGTLNISQTGSTATLTGSFDFTGAFDTDGQVSGNKVYIEILDSEEVNRIILTFNKDASPQSLSGTSKWVYDDGDYVCEGEHSFTGTCDTGTDCITTFN